MKTKEFYEKVTSDEVLRKKMQAVQSVEEGYAIAKELGVTDDQETFLAEMIRNEREFQQNLADGELAEGEISDEELTNITGGNEADVLQYMAACACACA